MEAKVYVNKIYVPSEDIVAREIEGELIIVPLAAGIGDVEDELFTMNETGKAIWSKLDGRRSLKKLIQELTGEFEAPPGKIQKDVVGLLKELLNRRMLVEASRK